MAALQAPSVTFPCDSTDRSTTPKCPLGTRAWDAAGNEYVYVKAGSNISALQAVEFAGSALGFDDVDPTSAADRYVLGAANGTAFTAGEYGFILTRGVTTVLATDAIAAGAPVASSATAGLLAAAGTSSLAYRGVVLVTNANADTVGATIYLF